MSVSYTVGAGGKSQTRQRGKREENSAVSTPLLNRGKRQPADSTDFGRTRNFPVGGVGAQRGLQKTAANSESGDGKSDASKIKTKGNLESSERLSNIVTLSDLKASGEQKEAKHVPRSRKTTTITSNKKTANGIQKNLVNINSSPKAGSARRVSGRKLGHSSLGKESNASRTVVNRASAGGLGARTFAKEYASLESPDLEIRNSKSNSHQLQVQPVAKIQRTPANKIQKGEGANTSSNSSNTSTAKKESSQSKKSRAGKMASPGYGSRGLYSSNARSVGQRPYQGQDGEETDPTLQGQSSSQQQQQQAGSAQYDGSAGFTRIAPNQGKRNKLTYMASNELAEYEKRKEARRQIRIEGPAQTTGGRKSEEDARLEMERQNRNKKYEPRLKREKYQREKREKEERENAEKKAKAREQAKKNEQRRAEREANFLRDEHQRTNEAFLRKIESGNRSLSESPSSTSSELQMLMEKFPAKSPAKLQEMLELTSGDVNKVIDLLN